MDKRRFIDVVFYSAGGKRARSVIAYEHAMESKHVASSARVHCPMALKLK